MKGVQQYDYTPFCENNFNCTVTTTCSNQLTYVLSSKNSHLAYSGICPKVYDIIHTLEAKVRAQTQQPVIHCTMNIHICHTTFQKCDTLIDTNKWKLLGAKSGLLSGLSNYLHCKKLVYLTFWTYIAYKSSWKTFFIWQAYTALPVYAMGLSITYLDIHCGLSGTIKTPTYTTVPVHRPWWCDMV